MKSEMRVDKFIILCLTSVVVLQLLRSTTALYKTPILNLCSDFQFRPSTTKLQLMEFGNISMKLPQHLISPKFSSRNITNVRFNLLRLNGSLCKKDHIISINMSVNNESPAINFVPEGYLNLDEEVYSGPSEYCIHKILDDVMELRVCNYTCREPSTPWREDNVICIPKCCWMGYALDLSRLRTEDVPCKFGGGTPWVPKVYKDKYAESPGSAVSNGKSHLYLEAAWELCPGKPMLVRTLRDIFVGEFRKRRWPFKILEDGSTVLKTDRLTWVPLTNGDFCIDGGQNFPNTDGVYVPGSYSGMDSDTVILECTNVIDKLPSDELLYAVFLLGSASCLAITILIHAFVHVNNGTYRLVCNSYFSSLLCKQISSAVAILINHSTTGKHVVDNSIADKSCTFFGIATHFFYIFTFCWLAVIGFDIWSTMKTTKSILDGRSGGLMKYLAYLAFSLVSSIGVIIVALVLDHFYRDEHESYVVVPRYGKLGCRLEPTQAPFYYLYLPVGLLLLANACFFGATVYNITSALQSTKQARENQPNQNRSRFFVFVRLFIIMGIPYIFEIVSAMSTIDSPTKVWVTRVIDLCTMSQGVLIFYLFCLSSKPRRTIFRKYPRLDAGVTAIIHHLRRLSSLVTPGFRRTDSQRSTATTTTELADNGRGSRDHIELKSI